MLISTWLQSFRNRLQPHPRRTSRRNPEQASQTLEHLEARHLLAAPQLIDVQDEGGRVIPPDTEIGNSPTELVLDFFTTPDLDATTLTGFTLERAGQDGAFDGIDVQVPIVSVTPGLANPNEVVLTLGQTLPSDLYRINIPGTLANTDAEQFNAGVDDLFNFSIQLPPPSLLAVRPDAGTFLTTDDQPIELDISPRELMLQFNPGQVIDPLTINRDNVRVERAGHDGAFGDAEDRFVNIGYVGIGDVPEEVVIRFAENLPDDDYRILLTGTGQTPISSVSGEILNNGTDSEFPFSLNLGARIIAIDPQPITRDATTGVLTQARRDIVLYFNDDELNAASAENELFYQLIFTNDTVTNEDDNPVNLGQAINPDTAVYDAVANTVTLTFPAELDLLEGSGTYRLRVGTDESIPLPPVTTAHGPGVDPGDSFDSQTLAPLGDLTSGGGSSQVISSRIEPEFYPFDFPGANDEPGHRVIEIETHLEGPADPAAGTTHFDYNFQSFYGFDPAGDAPPNIITAEQKQRAREVFEYYSTLLGIDFRETNDSGLTIATGDLRVLDPSVPTGPGGVTGIAGGGVAIMDATEVWDDIAGGNWFQTAMHEIGHLLGIGHTSDLAPVTVLAGDGFGNTNPGAFNGLAEDVFPGDHDIVHGQHLHRPDGNDIDLYSFNVTSKGQFSAEIMAERLLDSSQLDSQLRLFAEHADGSRTLIAQNDDYFSEDSFIQISLDPGTYYIGVSSTGNDQYDPTIPGTGFGGTSQGEYDLRVTFRPDVTNPANVLVDLTDTPFDGDSDGHSGGVYNFWLTAASAADTLIVDKEAADKDTVGRANDGSLGSPYLEIDQALAAATPGQIVRIVGNGGDDNDVLTIADNTPYQIGSISQTVDLEDGGEFVVPQGVTVMIDADTIIKFHEQAISVGSTTTAVNTSKSAIQILGTPGNDVILTSWQDETVGGNTTSVPTTPGPGDWGGVTIQNNVDEAEGRFSYRREGIFLNYMAHTTFQYGGGDVIIDGNRTPVNPINLTLAHPTIVHNTITDSRDSAVSADPDSFEEITFHEPRYQYGAQPFTADYTRVGPDVYWNTFVDNSTNGIFVRVQTEPGDPIQKLTVAGRFDDTDAVHVIAQNLEIQGTPGGPILDETPPDSSLIVLTTATVAGGSLTPAGTYTYSLVFVDKNGFESPPSAFTATATLAGAQNAIALSGLPGAPSEYVGRRLYRSDSTGGGPYMLAAQLGRSETLYTDDGTTFDKTLDVSVTQRNRPNYDARLAVDPGVVVKLEGARIETEIGAQFLAEGMPGEEIIFTSRLDDRFGAGGTFDTNDDGDLVSALTSFMEDNFESGTFDPGTWDTALTTASIDSAGLSESSGSQSAHLVPTQVLHTATIDLSGEPALELQYSFQRTGSGTGPDPNGNLFVQYRDSSNQWHTLESQFAGGPDMTEYQLSVVRLPGQAIHFTSAFRIAFGNPDDTNNIPTTGDWFVDDFRIVEARTNTLPAPGNWGGLYVGHLGSASIDNALITFGGGVVPVANDFSAFNALEIHQAEARIRNSVFERNADGTGGSGPATREGLFSNDPGAIFVRGAQPVIIDNIFRDNRGPVISINVNSLNSTLVKDPGRSTGPIDQDLAIVDNQGPLIDSNRLGDNDINGLEVRPATMTTQGVWDDSDIVHVLQGEVLVPDFHTYGGLRLESSSTASLVVKLQGGTAGFTAHGYPIDIDDRIGGSIQIVGQPGQPVVFTSLRDDGVGAGFDLRGFPLRDTNNDGVSFGSPGDWRSVRIAEFAHDRNVKVHVENEPADANSADVNNTIDGTEFVGLLANDYKSGDENLRLGYEIHGVIDSPSDQDIYSFKAKAGTHVWLDIDRTSVGLDSVIELLNSAGDILAQSDNSYDELNGTWGVFSDAQTQALPLNHSIFSDDLYTLNRGDAGMRITIPGAVDDEPQNFFVRVRSSNLNASFTPTILFSDDFEAVGFDPLKWTTVTGAVVDGIGLNEPSGVQSAHLNNVPAADLIESVDVDLSGQSDVQLTYSFQRTGGGDSTEIGEDLIFSYRNAGGSWIELDRQLGAGIDMNTYQSTTVDLPLSALHANFALRINTINIGGGTTDDWFVDDIEIASLPTVNRNTLQSNSSVADGLTTGVYQLQIRIQGVDEFAGSQVTHADIRFATNGVEVFGQPIHSLITGEAAETNGTTVLPNVLNTDRAAISISGNLTNPLGTEVDFYQFEVFYDVTQTIAGDGDDTAHVPVTFDVDYASGAFSRANTTIAVFNDQNELILIGRDSNISDDQPKDVGLDADVDDITRGSAGKADPFIGPVELSSGTYTLAVFSNDRVPAALNQYFTGANSGADLVRLEPVNSTQLIAEERFYSTTTYFDPVTFDIFQDVDFPVTRALPPVVDLFTVNGSTLDPKHVVPFHLGDVSLFVSADGATKPGDKTVVYEVDGFTGARETILGSFNMGAGDIAMRADGQLHTLNTSPPGNGAITDGSVSQYLTIDTGDASIITNSGAAGISTNLLNLQGNGSLGHDAGTLFEAMAYTGTDNGRDTSDLWAIGNRAINFPKQGQMGVVGAEYTSNILYNLQITNGSVDGLSNNNRTGNGGFNARDGAGTSQWEWGYVDTTFDNGGLQGFVTGMVAARTTFGGGTFFGSGFYAVDDAGGLYFIDFGGQTSTSLRATDPTDTFFNNISTTFIRNIGADVDGIGGLNLDFQGLAYGPENVENGLYADVLFGITRTGDIYAFDTTGELQPIFLDGQTMVSTGIFGVNGLDFGTLDYNLWHVTGRRGGLAAADDGHGIDVETFDDSVILPEAGGNSLYFGFEGGGRTPDPSFGGNSESGNKNTGGGNSVGTNVVNNVNFPGGAHGSVISNEFSLEGYSSNDKPTLYFNYFLQTEDANFNPGTNPDDLMRDAFRTFILDESGQWRLVTTSNSHHDNAQADEYDISSTEVFSNGFSNNPSLQTFPDVEETFDNEGWRQARVDLSHYAGMSGLKLRFDFSTAGSMNLGDLTTTGLELHAVPASEIVDGDTITLTDQFGQTTFEFDLGAHLTLPSGSAAIGQSFNVVGPDYSGTFTFTDAPVDPLFDIPAFESDSAADLAQRANDQVNAVFQGVRIQLPGGGFLQNESFRFRGEIFTYTSTPTRPQDILAEFVDTPQVMASRTVQVVESILGVGSAFANGAQVDLFGGTGIEFGGSLDITTTLDLEGESFTVNQQTFMFTSNPIVATDIDISGIGITTEDIATRAVAVINGVLGAGTAFVFPDIPGSPGTPGAPSRISIPFMDTLADQFTTGGTLFLSDVTSPSSNYELENFTVRGATFVLTDNPTRVTDILALPGETADDIAVRVRAAINLLFGDNTTLDRDPAVPERVSVPDLQGFSDGFLQGSTIVVQDVDNLANYEFEIDGIVFRFTDNPVNSTDILARVGDDPVAVAAEAVRIINQNLFGLYPVFQDQERIIVPDLVNTFDGVFQGAELDFTNSTLTNIDGDTFTVFDTTYVFTNDPVFTFFQPANYVEIDYSTATNAEDIAALAAGAINAELTTNGLAPRASLAIDTAGELVGVDFDPVATSPANWNHSDGGGGVDFVINDLVDELGNATTIDLSVIYAGGSGPGTVANTPNAVDIPTHSNVLTNIDGAITDESGLTLQFSDLTPGTTYEIYLFGGDAAAAGSQDVDITGVASNQFSQTWTTGNFVNDQPMTSANLDTFAVTAVADIFGVINVTVTETGPADTVVVPAVAIKQLPDPATKVEIAGAASTSLGTSFDIQGPDAAAINGDTITVPFGFFGGTTFTYVGNAPANQQQIQTDNNETIVAQRTADAINAVFSNFFFFGQTFTPAFAAGDRVVLPFTDEISYTDSGTNGSLEVSDYARLNISFFDPVDGDVLTVDGVDLTFVDTLTPVVGEIGSDGFGNWTDADIVSAANLAVFGAGAVGNGFGEVIFFGSPTFASFIPYLQYNDNGDGGLTIIDDGSGGNPFFFTQLARPAGVVLGADLPGSPMSSDVQGTTLRQDSATFPIARINAGPAKVTDNRITFRSATTLTTPGSILQVSGFSGTSPSTSGTTFRVDANNAVQLDGDTITVSTGFGFGTTFTYVDGTPSNGLEIQTSASSAITALRTKQVVETWFSNPGLFTLIGSDLTLTVPGQVRYTDNPLTLDGGISFPLSMGLPPISIDASMDANDVALAIRQAFADVYAASDVKNFKGYENVIQLIGHDVIDDNFFTDVIEAGPLTGVRVLPGDEFGAFDAGYVHTQRTLRPGSLRGMDNAVEGILVDDIIIGFAERGEMVTNAPAGTGFIQNAYVDDNSDLAIFNDLGDPNDNREIVNGRYDVEIRRASEVGLSVGTFNSLYRTLDTNDREVRGVAITVPEAIDIPDRTAFTVSNGINSVTFQFVDTRSSTLAADPGNIRILYNPIAGTDGTADDNNELIAQLIVNAINSDASQDAINPENLEDAFGVRAMYSDTTGTTSKTIHLTGNAQVTTDPLLANLLQITTYDFFGDSNRAREQGQIIIDSSFVTDSSGFGILVDAGARNDTLAHPGSVRTTQEVNGQRLVPGVVISNNVIVNNTVGGIRYSGDQNTNPDGVAPVGRIVNNTIYGGGSGTGVLVEQGAAPTLMNNILADLNLGINVDVASSAIVGSTLYQSNGTDTAGVGIGTFPIQLQPTDPLFVDAASGNFYPAPASQAIDSSLELLADNPEIVRVKTPLGGGLSPLLAPENDVFGQVRGDDDTVSTPSAQGGQVFLDRGAIDRVDFFSPTAVITNPEDGGASDLDPNPSVIWINLPETRREFRIRLVDQGIGIDDSKVDSNQFKLFQDGAELIDGVHYIWAYNAVNNDVIFTAVTAFDFERRYTITIENQPLDPADPDSIDGVQDLAGNYLAANQTDNTTQFDILVTDGINDPPVNRVPTDRQSMDEGSTLTFSTAGGNAISVTDADIHLAPNPLLNVTVSASVGTLTLGNFNGITFPTGDTGTNEASITFTGTITDLDAALEGLAFTPPEDYFNLLFGEDPATNPDPAVITISTNDDDGNGVGQFAGVASPVETDTDTILVDVISVNDAPTFNTPVADPAQVDEDTPGVISVPNFVTGMSPGPASESSQTTAFRVTSVTVTSGNLAFTQAPAISPTGTLTYELSPNTNGTADVTFVLEDFDSSDPNHVTAASTPETIEISVAAINDEPVYVLATNSVTSLEDAGQAGPFDLVTSFAAGPATATDETATPPAGQTATWISDATPTVTAGNLVFTQFTVAANGSLTYEVAPNTSGTATFDMWLMDDGPTSHASDDNQTAAVEITINVTAVADPPVPASPDYVIDEGDSLTLDGSGTTDPDTSHPGDTLTYAWDLDNDGAADDATGVGPTIPFSTLAGLGLAVPGDNTIRLEVTDTFSGTTEETSATLTILTVDYGDAPDSYTTLKASGGPAHTIVSGFHLGAAIDNEVDASADDGADEDGIFFEVGMQADNVIDVHSFLTATASAAGKLDVWIDFNTNGQFDASEHLNGGVSYDLVAGANRLDFTIAAGQANLDVTTQARARFSSTGGLTPVGRTGDGEVEDYAVQILSLLDPVAVQPVLPMWSQTSDLTPLLQWEQIAGSTPGANVSYNITLLNSLDQVVGFEENHASNFITLSSQLAADTYTVRVQGFNRAGVGGPIVDVDTFEVVPMMVTSPSGSVPDGFPTITWTPLSDKTDHYELEIVSAISGATLVTENNLPATGSSYTVTSELPLDEYRARVRAIEDTTLQAGDWSPWQNFVVSSAPTLTAPVGSVDTGTPTVSWTAVPGAETYEVRISDLTDDIVPIQSLTGITSTSVTLSTALDLGEYLVEIRGVTSQGAVGNWSSAAPVLVGVPPVINQPSGRVEDSTPTIIWAAVAGAENYDVEIFDQATSQIVHQALALTGTEYTVPDGSDLPLGNYDFVVRANNLAATSSTRGTASVESAASAVAISTPPVVTGPAVGIYDTTPTIEFTTPAGAVTSEVEIQDGAGAIVLSSAGVSGNSYTVPGADALTPGQYRVRVRSVSGTIVSEWSVPHFFQIGGAPIVLGPDTGIGTAPHFRTEDPSPTISWVGQVAGETYDLWVTNVSEGTTLQVVNDINTESYALGELPNGHYRVWVRAQNGLGEYSDWSAAYDFQITVAPTVAAIGPNFDTPTIAWQSPANTPSTEVSYYQMWINDIDVTPNQKFLVLTDLTVEQYISQTEFPNGRYKVWTRAYTEGANPLAPLVVSSWSNGVVFEVSGRPIVDMIDETTDSTPTLTWSPVAGAATYEAFVSKANDASVALVRQDGLTDTRFTIPTPLDPGDYVFWIRATSTAGNKSPWSVTPDGHFTINAAGRPVIDAIPVGSNQTPTITWSAASGADHYEIYISTTNNVDTALVRNDSINDTFFTVPVALPPGVFRVWVRAISASNFNGPWSNPVDFVIVSNDQKTQEPESTGILASLEAAGVPLDPSDVTVSLVPARVVEDSGRQIANEQTNVANLVTRIRRQDVQATEDGERPVAELANNDADNLMSEWDDAIWAEESGEATSQQEQAFEKTAELQTESKKASGLLAGLALLSPKLLRRKRRSNDK